MKHNKIKRDQRWSRTAEQGRGNGGQGRARAGGQYRSRDKGSEILSIKQGVSGSRPWGREGLAAAI